MTDRHFGPFGADRAAERGRGVALDDQQFGAVAAKLEQGRGRDLANVAVGILSPGAAQADDREVGEAMLGGVERGMLAAQDDARLEAAVSEGMGDWRQFDGFGPGPYDQADP